MFYYQKMIKKNNFKQNKKLIFKSIKKLTKNSFYNYIL